ncbi:unnamed protein product [Ectocarpus sp. CCAP 1310/34]|nr:unnamed protein product [Ectocarpus sp. CCAP 1310/34]
MKVSRMWSSKTAQFTLPHLSLDGSQDHRLTKRQKIPEGTDGAKKSLRRPEKGEHEEEGRKTE